MTTNDGTITTAGRDWKNGILLLGVFIGALTGLGAAYLLIQKAEDDKQLNLSPSEGVKLGLSVFSFLRQVTQLGK